MTEPSELRQTHTGALACHEPADAELPDFDVQLRGILALAVDAIISTDDHFRITLFNSAAERIFGYRRDEVLGEPLDCLLPELARAAHHAHLEQFRHASVDSKDMGRRGQIWGRRKDGELFPAEASISKIRIGDRLHFTAVLRDITQQRRAELERETLLLRTMEARAAAESAERRVAFLSAASEMLHSSLAYEETFEKLARLIVPELATCCVVDIVEASGRIRRMHAVHADPQKQPLADRLRSYPAGQAHLTSRAIAEAKPQLIGQVTDDLLVAAAENADHLEILRALVPASAMLVPLVARKKVLGALLFVRDAAAPAYGDADLALAQELAQRAASALDNAQLYDEAQRAIRARDDVLGVVSHDLRNPISVISMCATSLLTNDFADEAQSREALQIVQQSTAWALRLIQDLLDVSSIEAGRLSMVRQREDPVLLVTKAVLLLEEIAAERSITLATELPETMPSVDVDADRILQALGNLIGNAVKFTPLGGTVRVGASEEGGQIRLYVADSGPGIPDADLPHIFERFWTAPRSSRVRGAGMGLAIVRGVVDAHGGRVWAERGENGGARFTIALPVVESTIAT